MKLNTELYGELEFNTEDIIIFKTGLLGLPKYKKYLLLSCWDKSLPFYTLYSTEENDFYFILIKADEFFTDYKIKLTSADKKALNYSEGDIVQVFNIVNFADDIEDITVNLKGPLVINLSGNIGKQVVLDSDKYDLKYPLFKKFSQALK
ncbi:flagellar assembly protein FliW [Halothermothrix orenii]|nr:flagellar assembly protein FliW [Halothermothrix orenii]